MTAETYQKGPDGRRPLGTLVDLFRMILERPREDLLRFKQAGRYENISSQQFGERVRHLAAFLTEFGVRRGDRIALLSENRPEWPISDFAIQIAGAITVPLYTTLSADTIRYVLKHSSAKAILVSREEHLGRIREAVEALDAPARILVFDAPPTRPSEPLEIASLAEALEHGSRSLPRFASEVENRMGAVRPDDVATIIYTSGTTGTPKGVMLTHENICSNVNACLPLFRLGPGDVALSFLPLSHVFERTVEYLYLAAGGSIAYAESIERVPENLQEVRPTVLSAVPRVLEKIHGRVLDSARSAGSVKRWMFERALVIGHRRLTLALADQPIPRSVNWKCALADRLVYGKIRGVFGGRARFVISGGAPLAREIAEFFLAADLKVLEGYGLTETAPVIAVNTPEKIRPGTVGRPIPGVEVRIAGDGEILVKGPNVMKGYFNDEAGTAEAIRDGFFATGDIGELDAEGFLRITDRKKDLLVTSGGKNVAPQPIENAIKQSPYISNAVLVGDRRPFITALIVPDFGALRAQAGSIGLPPLEPSDLSRRSEVRDLIASEIEAATRSLSKFEKVKRFSLLERDFSVEAGELTPTLKIKRRVILERYRPAIEAMYAGETEPEPAR